MTHSPRGIVAAACRLGELTFSMPAPARHHDVLTAMSAAGLQTGTEDQGFLDHRGLFLGRRSAKVVAYRFGQVTRESLEEMPELYSEDLW